MYFPLEKLPNELLSSVISSRVLSPIDRYSIGCVSQKFAQLTANEGLITARCEEVHVDFEKQVLVVRWAERCQRYSVSLNGNLKHNKSANSPGGSCLFRFLHPERDSVVVRDLGDHWNKLVGIYLAKMKHIFAERKLFSLKFILPNNTSLLVPELLLKLGDVHVEFLEIHRMNKETSDAPETLFPLMNRCDECHVPYFFNSTTLSQISADQLNAAVRDTDAVRIIQEFMAGSLAIRTRMCRLDVHGNLGMFLGEALLHAGGNSEERESQFMLPKKEQAYGKVYVMWIYVDGRIAIYKTD